MEDMGRARYVGELLSGSKGVKDFLEIPEVSFAIRHLSAQGGVNVTASHNPKEYNGYKAYWEVKSMVMF